MTYPALPDRHMPYDNDGTVVYYSITGGGYNVGYSWGGHNNANNSFLISLNGPGPNTELISDGSGLAVQFRQQQFWFFFPEQREVTAYVWTQVQGSAGALDSFQGSNNSTNGVDGTWETASAGGGPAGTSLDAWRSSIQTLSFTGAKNTVRCSSSNNSAPGGLGTYQLHVYGEKAAGQTPDDILFLDAQNADAEFTAPIDFGDRPLGTTATHQFKVKNASATHTANSINLQCNDADFAISTDGVTYVATINISSLAAGAKSSVMYVRDTTPNPGAALGPRYARIVATVGSYT